MGIVREQKLMNTVRFNKVDPSLSFVLADTYSAYKIYMSSFLCKSKFGQKLVITCQATMRAMPEGARRIVFATICLATQCR